jgi:hypothetical protein
VKESLLSEIKFNYPCSLIHAGDRVSIHASQIRRREDAVIVPALANLKLITCKIVALLKGTLFDKFNRLLAGNSSTADVEHKEIQASRDHHDRDGSYDQPPLHRHSLRDTARENQSVPHPNPLPQGEENGE